MFPREHRFFARKRDHNRSEAVLIGIYGAQTVLHAKPDVETPIPVEAAP
jgi:hypothetical protein